jgi:ParB family chromosome partitioning protein
MSAMTEPESKRRSNLGRGLNALLGDDNDEYTTLDRVRGTRTVPVQQIEPSRVQPRRRFDKDELESLTQSIREKGVIQPLLVRRHPDDPSRYELVAGERRWLAAQAAQLHEVPVVVRELDNGDALEIALIENLQRQDLTPLEEAEGYKRLMDEFSHTQDALAQVIGKSRSHVANMLRLLTLPQSVKELVDEGQLSAGHARALINVPGAEELAKHIVSKGLNVRETERLVQSGKKPSAPRSHAGAPAETKSADTLALEKELSNLLGLRVEISAKGTEGGALIIRYKTLEQLDDVLQRLSRGSI